MINRQFASNIRVNNFTDIQRYLTVIEAVEIRQLFSGF